MINIKLPKGAFIVKQDDIQEDNLSIILSIKETKKKPNTGTIVFVSEELKNVLNRKVVFRENFSEPINIGDEELLFFRDFNSSIYYTVVDEESKG
jgi:hypothetical protein